MPRLAAYDGRMDIAPHRRVAFDVARGRGGGGKGEEGEEEEQQQHSSALPKNNSA